MSQGALVAALRLLAGRLEGPPQSLAEHEATTGPVPVRPPGGADLLDELASSGLTGCGGGAFPVAAKWSTVLAQRSTDPLVVVNGAEGEPASLKDAWLLQHRPHLVLDGMELAAARLGAREAVVVVSIAATATRRAVEQAIAERRTSRRSRTRTRLVTCPDRYVASEESALVALLEGKAPLPTSRGSRPVESGVHGRPTLVQNTETLAHVALIAHHGADWFRGAGTLASPGTRLLTLSGAVTRPGVIEIGLEETLGAALDRAGAGPAGTQAVLVGGYFGRWVSTEAGWDLDLSAASLRAVGLGLGAGVLVALPRTTCPVRESSRVLRWLAGQSAGQCGPCVFGLPAIADTMERVAQGSAQPSAMKRLERWSAEIPGRGACRHPDGAVGLLRSTLLVFSSHVGQHLRGQRCGLDAAPVCSLPDWPAG